MLLTIANILFAVGIFGIICLGLGYMFVKADCMKIGSFFSLLGCVCSWAMGLSLSLTILDFVISLFI